MSANKFLVRDYFVSFGVGWDFKHVSGIFNVFCMLKLHFIVWLSKLLAFCFVDSREELIVGKTLSVIFDHVSTVIRFMST